MCQVAIGKTITHTDRERERERSSIIIFSRVRPTGSKLTFHKPRRETAAPLLVTAVMNIYI